MNAPIEEPLAVGEPFAGTVALSENAITQRDKLCEDAETVTTVASDEQLSTAVEYLKDINAFLKKNEEGRKKEKAPHLEYGKLVDNFAAKFALPLDKAKARITALVDGWQRKQLMEKEARDRKAREEVERAQQAAAAAQAEIERQQRLASLATTKAAQEAAAAKLMEAELKAETAALHSQQAAATLAIPTNTPRGLVTKVRFDFEVTDWRVFIDKASELWRWDKAAETLKVDRAGIIKTLNSDNPGEYVKWLPEETQQSVTLPEIGIRVYRDIRSSTRS